MKKEQVVRIKLGESQLSGGKGENNEGLKSVSSDFAK